MAIYLAWVPGWSDGGRDGKGGYEDSHHEEAQELDGDAADVIDERHHEQ